jgi:hypothetical protein
MIILRIKNVIYKSPEYGLQYNKHLKKKVKS